LRRESEGGGERGIKWVAGYVTGYRMNALNLR
jgi:hypothetical protein